jgi:hypothetical protein
VIFIARAAIRPDRSITDREIVFDEEYDPFTVDTLDQAREHLKRNASGRWTSSSRPSTRTKRA